MCAGDCGSQKRALGLLELESYTYELSNMSVGNRTAVLGKSSKRSEPLHGPPNPTLVLF